MIKEKWDYKYATLSYNGKKYTITIVHYQSFSDPELRPFFRILGQGFTATQPASTQIFGFGYDLESAFKRFFHSIDFVNRGLAVEPMKGLNDHRRA